MKEETGPLDAFLARGDATVILVAFLLVAPVAEEIFFRGVAYNAWERERGPWVAVIGSALLFAAIHGSLFAVVPIFALGSPWPCSTARPAASPPRWRCMPASTRSRSPSPSPCARGSCPSRPDDKRSITGR
jgi:hypothetical protein